MSEKFSETKEGKLLLNHIGIIIKAKSLTGERIISSLDIAFQAGEKKERSQVFDEAIEIIEIWELDGISKCPDHGKNACLFCVLEQIEKKLKEKRGMK